MRSRLCSAEKPGDPYAVSGFFTVQPGSPLNPT